MRLMGIVKGDRHSETGVPPDRKILRPIGKCNEEPVKAEQAAARG
jgi:hypothetical protein